MPKIVDHDARRVELARAVWAVVGRDGVGAASIRAVAAEAGWTHGAITHYFKRRDDLLLFAYRLAIERETASSPTEEEEPDPFERLVGLLLRTLPVDERSALDVRIWLAFMGRVADEPDLAQAVLQEHRSHRARIRTLVRTCFADSRNTGDHQPVRAARDTPDAGMDGYVDDLTDMVTAYADGLGIAASLDPATCSPQYLERSLRLFLSSIGLSSPVPQSSSNDTHERKSRGVSQVT